MLDYLKIKNNIQAEKINDLVSQNKEQYNKLEKCINENSLINID